jgi:hypothetical protein
LLQFRSVERKEPALVAGAVPVDGEGVDSLTYKVPLRNLLVLTDGATVQEHGTDFSNSYLGDGFEQGYNLVERQVPSRYFVVPSKEPIIHQGNRPLVLAVDASHSVVASAGGVVDYRVRIGAPASASSPAAPLRLAIVLDFSDSARDDEVLALLRAAAHHFVDQILPGDSVAIVVSAVDVRLLLAAGTQLDRSDIHRDIDALVPGGSGSLPAAILAAYSQLDANTNPGESGHVLVVSDGRAGLGGTGAWRLVDLAKQRFAESRLRLSSVGLGTDMNGSFLFDLARAGEGRFAYLRNPGEVAHVLGRQLEGLFRVYARHVALDLTQGGGGQVLSVHAAEFSQPLRGTDQVTLSDIAAGEERSLLVRVAYPPAPAGESFETRFLLQYEQLAPVRRTTIPRTVTLRSGAAPAAPDNQAAADYARLVLGIEEVRRALDAGDEAAARGVIEFLEGEFGALKARALSSGDAGLAREAQSFERFATGLKSVYVRGRLTGSSIEREDLRRELEFRR